MDKNAVETRTAGIVSGIAECVLFSVSRAASWSVEAATCESSVLGIQIVKLLVM